MLDFRSDCYRFLFLSLFYLKQDPHVEIRYKFKGDILEPFQSEALYNEVDTVFQTGADAVSTTAWAHSQMKVHNVSSLALLQAFTSNRTYFDFMTAMPTSGPYRLSTPLSTSFPSRPTS